MPHEKDHKIRVEDIFRQSPIPQPPPTITDEEFNRVFNERSRKFQEEKQGLRDRWQEHLDTTGILDKEEEKKEEGNLLDWFISPARGEGGLEIDKKHPPMWQLADAEFRTQLNPQGVAKFADMYRDPSKYAHLAYYYPKDDSGYFPHGLTQNVDAFYMDTPSEAGESEWQSSPVMPYEAILPNQLFRQGHTYLSTAGMDRPKVPDRWWIRNAAIRGLGKGPEDNWHHEAFHDASDKAVKSEFMSVPHRTIYNYLSVARPLGIRIEEALAQYHDSLYPKSRYAAENSKQWLSDEKEEAENESLDPDNTPQQQKAWGVYLTTLKHLDDLYNQILRAAQQRHESLGYK